MIKIEIFTFNAFGENTYVLFNENKEAVVIDPGNNSTSENKELTDFIEKNELEITKLLNTHAHIDHVLGNHFVKEKYRVKLYLHEKDLFNLNACPMAAKMYGIHPYHPAIVDEYLEEGQQILLGDDILDIIFVPGHAPGHVAFVNHKQKFVIGGDVLFRQSVGRTDFPGCSHQDLLKSIREKMFTLEEDYTVFPGHGPETTIGYEKKYNPFLQ